MLMLLVTIVALVGLTSGQEPQLDAYGLINVLYLKSDMNGDGTITQAELDEIFNGFDHNNDSQVTETEFVTAWHMLTGQSQEMSKAFFYLADLTDDSIINQADLRPLYQVFDLNGDGQVSAQEFANKWLNIIDESSFAVLFIRSDINRDNMLSHDEFLNYLSSFDTDKNHKISPAEFKNGWTSSHFGTVAQAQLVFHECDTNNDNIIDATDLGHLFTQFDISHNHKLEMLEIVKLAQVLIVNHSSSS